MKDSFTRHLNELRSTWPKGVKRPDEPYALVAEALARTMMDERKVARQEEMAGSPR